MANIKVSELPSASSFNDEDLVMIVQSNESKKISGENLLKEVGKKYEYSAPMLNGTKNIVFKRYGHVVEINYNGAISSFPVRQEILILENIPTEFRPNYGIHFSTANSVPAKVRLLIYPDGRLTAYSYDNAITYEENFQYHVTYLVD